MRIFTASSTTTNYIPIVSYKQCFHPFDCIYLLIHPFTHFMSKGAVLICVEQVILLILSFINNFT